MKNNKLDKLVLSGWYAPDPNNKSMERYCSLKLNHLYFLRSDYSCIDLELTEKYLKLCDEYNVDAYIFKDRDVEDIEAFKCAKNYKKHSSFKGFCMYDEPHFDKFDEIEGTLSLFEKDFPSHDFFVNLFPDYAPPSFLGGNWEKYIEAFGEKILGKINSGKRIMSFDFYPICYDEVKGNYIAENWISCTAKVADTAKKYNADCNFFIQSMAFSGSETKRGSRDREPTFLDISMQVYVALSFGAKMISYFCYNTPEVNHEFMTRQYAIIKRNGEKSEIYESVREINQEILFFADEFIKYNRITTIGISKNNCQLFKKLPKDLPDNLKDIIDFCYEGDMLLGVFENGVNYGFIAVDVCETTKSTKKKLVIKNKQHKKIAVTIKKTKRIYEEESEISLEMEIGGGLFLEICNLNIKN